MTALMLRGDARRLPLPDASVDLIVTSPPYFALRSYTDGGEHYAGQIGSEATPAEYIAALVACTREWIRVLKPSGSLFVDLGDKYGAKSLMLLPERYRIACVDELGLIARQVIVWSKPNGLPESVTDRVRRSHEDWVHLTKQPRYFAAVDEIREEVLWPGKTRTSGKASSAVAHLGSQKQTGLGQGCENPLGKLPGSVWEVATEPLRKIPGLDVDHFAAFPSEWPRRLILGWSPSGICTSCGEGRRPVAEVLASGGATRRDGNHRYVPGFGGTQIGRSEWVEGVRRAITGYVCACPEPSAPTRPAVVLDPFGGTGTTAHVADALGRTGISVDMSHDYCRLAAAPELADARRRKVLGFAKPEPVPAAQGDLFAEDGAA
jgi:DNA modification methylase